ncbi:MAG: hypothetical protein KatS3mg024_1542 [Armatimonadota bacterium]|nr:MAG: hypothetical protein KatS3mg024_1542 [Armatimonadota bacterium]
MDFMSIIKESVGDFPQPAGPVRALGIDLGTTNSTVAEAVYDPETQSVKVHCLDIPQVTAEGEYISPLVPSVVVLHDGREWVGEGAKRLLAQSGFLKLIPNRHVFSQCKNDIGTDKPYLGAPVGYQNAAEIGGKVLSFLHSKALEALDTAPERVVVTVPASFQAAQRYDTLKAAKLAGLDVDAGGLLDEPMAAFLDYACTQGSNVAEMFAKPKVLLVFDFGGGTCDVAVFRVSRGKKKSRLEIAALSVSRYHRLGGGDIDASIVHDVLIPQLIQQNGIGPHDLTFDEKRLYVEPALMGVAESLKIKLCIELERLRKFGRDAKDLTAKLPGVFKCPIQENDYVLESPAMSLSQFNQVLEPFLDHDVPCVNEGEYYTTCPIFLPVADALSRSDLDPEDVDYCLMVGGSSLIPQVVDGIREFLPEAEILEPPDRDAVQLAVARGAAFHAMALALTGSGFFRPVAHDSLCVRHQGGLLELVPKGAELPYPQRDKYALNDSLMVLAGEGEDEDKIRLEIVAGRENRTVAFYTWPLDTAEKSGARIFLEYYYDENQVLKIVMGLADGSVPVLVADVQNPLTHVVNPHSTRTRINEIERRIRHKEVAEDEMPWLLKELAEEYWKLAHRERALACLRSALQRLNYADAGILYLMGIIYAEMQDYERAEKLYRKAAEASGWGSPLFSLALMYRQQKRYEEAIESVELAMDRKRDGAYVALRGLLAGDVNDAEARASYLREALDAFGKPEFLDDWALRWFLTAAQAAGDSELVEEAKAEQRKRRKRGGTPLPPEGLLPTLSPRGDE